MSQRRWYGTATELPSGQILATEGQQYSHMVMFGGRSSQNNVLSSDVDRFKLTASGEWDTPVQPTPPLGASWPEARKDHTLVVGPEYGPMFLFGGEDELARRNDVYVLSRKVAGTNTNYEWYQPSPVAGQFGPPDPRSLHAAVARNEPPIPGGGPPGWFIAMYVFGGLDGSSQPRGDLWRFTWDPTAVPPSWKWNPLSAGGGPSARYGHTAVYDQHLDMAIFFGGKDSPTQFSDNNGDTIWGLKFGGATPAWQQITVTGARRPEPRYLHAMANDIDERDHLGAKWHREFVYGGEKAGGVLSDSLWTLWISPDGTSAEWEPLAAVPKDPVILSPVGRSRASLIHHAEDDAFVIFGGDTGGAADPYAWTLEHYSSGGAGPEWQWRRLPSYGHNLTGHSAFLEREPVHALVPEIYDPNATPPTWTRVESAAKELLNYARMFTGPNNRLLMAGPMLNYEWKSYRLDLNNPTPNWLAFPTTGDPDAFAGLPAVMYRPGYVMKSGGAVNQVASGMTKSIVLGDLSNFSTPWVRSVNDMMPRLEHNLTMLPSGQVLATGGTLTNGPAQPVLNPELWDPEVTEAGRIGRWYSQTNGTSPQTLAASQVSRNYHSTALLLPDGRVLSAGGDGDYKHFSTQYFDQWHADIYCPPYLFNEFGAQRTRPQLKGVQEKVNYGQTFSVLCPDPITKAVLIRPGAVTHAFNQDQHFVSLAIEAGTGPPCYQVHAPSVAERASIPPGDYLLFVLDAQGVPAIAEWVRLGDEAATTYTTCDDTPPAAVNNLTVQREGITVTLNWSAPPDGPSNGSASTYEIRYRPDIPFSPTPPRDTLKIDDFLEQGIQLSNPPAPAIPGTPQSLTAAGFDPQRTYYFRLISKDNAGSYRNWSELSTEAIAQAAPGGGGCPTVDTRTAAGWEEENTILARSLTAAASLDGYRLKREPEVASGRINIRVRENESEVTSLDQVRLIAVDHALGLRAFAVGERVVLGTRVPAARVTRASGEDITAQVDGSGGLFVGEPGETLLVEMSPPAAGATRALRTMPGGDGPPIDGDGGKDPPGSPGNRARPAVPAALENADAMILGSTGIVIEAPDGLGGWTTIGRRYPRKEFDEALLDTVPHSQLRLIFVGRHSIHFLGRLAPSLESFTATKCRLVAADHSRLGDVRSEVEVAGNVTTTLQQGDTLGLGFEEPPLATGQVREYFLLSRGVYTSNLPAALWHPPDASTPTAYALLQNRPNPFSGGTTIGFELPRSERVKLEVFDLAGRRVRVLVNEAYAPGSWIAEWDRRDASGSLARPGVYLYRLEAGHFRAQRKMVLGP